MLSFLQFLRFISLPALFGLSVALVIALVFPERFPLPVERIRALLAPEEVPKAIVSTPYSFADAVSKASASVVNIYTLRQQAVSTQFNPLTGRYNSTENKVLPSTGSGVIVSDEGHIITNFHVLESAQDIRVALRDGREATPEIVGFSKEDDMAVLKINLENMQPIEIGDPNSARVGDIVLAIGNPFGVGQTVTQGIISGTHRKGLNLSFFENFIQTDAAINPGNSGGALIDTQGRLLGINIGDLRQTNYGDASGIGFAIPADRAIQAMTDIVEYGKVVRGWLGVSAIDINERIVSALNLKTSEGVLLTQIIPSGSADIAGLLPGDVVTAIDGIETPSMLIMLKEFFGNSRPGDVITLDVLRDNERMQVQVVVSAKPE